MCEEEIHDHKIGDRVKIKDWTLYAGQEGSIMDEGDNVPLVKLDDGNQHPFFISELTFI